MLLFTQVIFTCTEIDLCQRLNKLIYSSCKKSPVSLCKKAPVAIGNLFQQIFQTDLVQQQIRHNWGKNI